MNTNEAPQEMRLEEFDLPLMSKAEAEEMMGKPNAESQAWRLTKSAMRWTGIAVGWMIGVAVLMSAPPAAMVLSVPIAFYLGKRFGRKESDLTGS